MTSFMLHAFDWSVETDPLLLSVDTDYIHPYFLQVAIGLTLSSGLELAMGF